MVRACPKTGKEGGPLNEMELSLKTHLYRVLLTHQEDTTLASGFEVRTKI